jgi:Zn ribbon nucleic-acid-binding protein
MNIQRSGLTLASLIYALKCPCCKRSAIIDDYYNTDEKYIYCLRCGYNYSKTIERETAQSVEYKEEEYEGNGVFILVNKDGSRKSMLLNKVTDEHLEEHMALFEDDTVDREKSYLVSYKDEVFTILNGNPPANFYLSFEDYKKKMLAKYGESECDFMVPVEE